MNWIIEWGPWLVWFLPPVLVLAALYLMRLLYNEAWNRLFSKEVQNVNRYPVVAFSDDCSRYGSRLADELRQFRERRDHWRAGVHTSTGPKGEGTEA
jgi:hypothetical protein